MKHRPLTRLHRLRRLPFLTLLLAAALAILTVVPVHASQPCEPPNVIPQPVCDMDSFYGSPPRQLPNGWNPFILSGDLNYYQDDHTYFGGPNLTMSNNGGTFKAGIFTQVQVTPGAGYRASISWGAPNAPDLFGRQLGIDPTGGMDPNAPTVIWGKVHWGEGRILNYPPPDVNIDVLARATGSTMTVFFLADHPSSSGDNIILVDAIALYPDENAPAAIVAPPTETPTNTPEPVIAAVAAPPVEIVAEPTATPTATETPTLEPTATPTNTPEPTATPSPTPSPTPTITPTWTPWPSATPENPLSVDGVQTRLTAVAGQVDQRIFLAVGALGVSGAGLSAGTLLWLRRRRR
jgi:hypothetical protein